MAYAGSPPSFLAFLISKFQHYPHFTGEETEVQKDAVTLTKAKHGVNARAQIEPGQSDCRAHDLQLPVVLVFPPT